MYKLELHGFLFIHTTCVYDSSTDMFSSGGENIFIAQSEVKNIGGFLKPLNQQDLNDLIV